MTDRLRSRVFPILRRALILGLSLVALGCGLFKPDEGGPPPQPPFQYPDLSTPQNAVLNLKYAWERRDSARTLLIYDDAYVGESTDKDGTILFSKDQEVAALGAISQSQDVQSVSFSLRPETTWVRLSYPTDDAGWTAIQLQGVNIQVDDAAKGTLIASSANFFEFKLVPTLDAASPTDTTWKIVRWTETRN
jgi:hypothetical protein